jgi:uncharacterized Fe-S center protein
MASRVYFVDSSASQKKSVLDKLSTLFVRAGLADCVSEDDLVAVKVHFGELGNTGYLSPIYARTIVAEIRKLGGKPFLTDSNTLYKGHRQNAVDHIETALANGFGYSTVDAPVVIADGLWGRDHRTVKVEGAVHCPEVKIGAAAVDADAMIVLTHFKGHMAMGFGGTFKNVGMGLGARSAKQVMHSDLRPDVDAPTCTRCGDCVKSCPASAIVIGAESAIIDLEACVGCGECTATCRYGAIAVMWETEAADLQRRVAEHFAGAIKGKEGKVGYVTCVISVTPDCDCWQFTDPPFVADIGMLASADPVALDQAALDLVTAAPPLASSRIADLAPGEDKFLALHGVDGTAVLDHAVALGLGSRDYELVRL